MPGWLFVFTKINDVFKPNLFDFEIKYLESVFVVDTYEVQVIQLVAVC
jgi:hypothetical protein